MLNADSFINHHVEDYEIRKVFIEILIHFSTIKSKTKKTITWYKIHAM